MVPHVPHIFEFIHLKDRKDLPHLAIVSLLISGIILGVYLSMQPQLFNKKAAEGSLVDVTFVPESLQVQRAGTYEAKIAVNPKSERVTGIQLEIGYDPLSVTILEVRNEGFLPVNLKTKDSFDGNLTIIYAGTVETQATTPGTLATIKFRVTQGKNSEILIKQTSQVSVSSEEGNVLTAYSKLNLIAPENVPDQPSNGEVKYPDNLLLEKPVIPDSSPFVEDFKEALEPDPEIKPERLKPQMSEAYLKQLGKDIFIDPIVALNEVIQDKASEIIQPDSP